VNEENAATVRHLPWTSAALSLAFILAFVIVTYSLYQGHHEACQTRNISLNVMRDLLLDAEMASLNRPDITAQEYKTIREFYARQFIRIQKARC